MGTTSPSRYTFSDVENCLQPLAIADNNDNDENGDSALYRRSTAKALSPKRLWHLCRYGGTADPLITAYVRCTSY